MATVRLRGFTLVELMVTVSVISILAAIAVPAYSAYITRSRIPAGLDALTAYAMRMEQSYQDQGSYGTTECRLALPAAANFTLACELSGNGQAFTATATGVGPLSGYSYSIDQNAIRRTLAHPGGRPSGNCWSLKGSSCDG